MISDAPPSYERPPARSDRSGAIAAGRRAAPPHYAGRVTTYEPPRPWIASYAEGVPEDLEPVTGSLVDIVEASARDYPDAPALQFFGRTTSYRELHEARAQPAHTVEEDDGGRVGGGQCVRRR